MKRLKKEEIMYIEMDLFSRMRSLPDKEYNELFYLLDEYCSEIKKHYDSKENMEILKNKITAFINKDIQYLKKIK